MTSQLPGLNSKSENVPPAYHWMLVSMYPTYVWFLALNFVLLFELQVGQRCTLGWSPFGTLFSWVCHRIWLPVRVLEQGPAGAFHPGDRQCVTPHVWEVLRPRLGVPVPAQPPAHQLCCSAHRKPGLHDPRLVNKDSSLSNVFVFLALWRWRECWSIFMSSTLVKSKTPLQPVIVMLSGLGKMRTQMQTKNSKWRLLFWNSQYRLPIEW